MAPESLAMHGATVKSVTSNAKAHALQEIETIVAAFDQSFNSAMQSKTRLEIREYVKGALEEIEQEAHQAIARLRPLNPA